MSYDFHFVRNKTGELSGQSMVVQTELALSEIGTTAETAQETAESAASTASTALSTAESAESLAGTAQTTADKAVSLANTAQEAADTAQATAEAAQATADEAVELANTAQATAETAQATADTKAPIYHANEEETYGVGNEDLYGHLKLLDEADEDYTISSGVAATPYALSLIKDEAETAQATADTAVSLANTSQTAADSAMSYAKTVNATVTSLSTTVEGIIADRDFTVTDTVIDADDYTDYARLYLTVDSTNLPSGATYPLYFWADATDGGVKQTVLSGGVIYTRTGVDTDTDNEDADADTEDTEDTEDDEDDEEESTWEWSDWTAVALASDLTAHISDTDNPHNVTASQLGLATAYKYCGTVSTYDDLPTDAGQGDVYNVDDTGANYAWTGEEWDKLSETVDLSSYATIDYVDSIVDGIEAISDSSITALFV